MYAKTISALFFYWLTLCLLSVKAQNPTLLLTPPDLTNASGYVNSGNINTSGDIKQLSATKNRGYITFSLSQLPNGALVTGAVLTVYAGVNTSFAFGNSTGKITFVKKNSTLTTITYAEIASGTTLGDLEFDGTSGPKVINLNAAAVNLLNSASGSSICLGIYPPTAGSYSIIGGYNSADALARKPELKIVYTTGSAQKPSTDFYANTTKPIINEDVSFFDASGNGPITSWQWDFGDGITSTQQHPKHTYTLTGNYTVSLTATNAQGSTQSVKTDYIEVFPIPAPPVADFDADKYEADIPFNATITFTDKSANNPVSWMWDFGDGTTGEGPTAYHEYTAPGRYSVTLIATNNTGSDTITKEHFINAFDSFGDAVADFKFDTLDLQVTFTDLSLNKPATWNWDFDKNNPGVHTSTEQNPVFSYDDAGTYEVCLTVENNNNFDPSTVCKMVTVTGAVTPKADFSFLQDGLEVSFSDLSSFNPVSWEWDFGDGSEISTEQNPQYTYASGGTYNVKLKVMNPAGSDSVTKSVTVSDIVVKPEASFSFKTEGALVRFTDESVNYPNAWFWNFGDGGTASVQNPSYTYAETGIYNVCLTAFNSAGSDTLCKAVSVTAISQSVGAGKPTSFFIAPNPASETVYLNMKEKTGKPFTMTLYNAMGQEVGRKSFDALSTTHTLDISGITKGQYLIAIQDGMINGTQKLFIE